MLILCRATLPARLAVYYLVPPLGRLSVPSRYCTTNVTPSNFVPTDYSWGPGSLSRSPTPTATTGSPSSSATPSFSPTPTASASTTGPHVSLSSTPSPSATYAGAHSDPCFNYTTISDITRRISRPSTGYDCDGPKLLGWYRFIDSGGFNYVISTHDPHAAVCNAYYPVAIVGNYPQKVGEVVSLQATVDPVYSNFGPNDVQVKHCGRYLVYYLTPPTGTTSCVYFRYCTTTAPPPGFTPVDYLYTPLPTTTSSSTPPVTPTITASASLTPTGTGTPVSITATPSSSPTYQLAADPCYNYVALNDPTREIGTASGVSYSFKCDNTLAAGWYRFDDGAFGYLPSAPPRSYTCSTQGPMYVPAAHPTQPGQIISAYALVSDNGPPGPLNISLKHCGSYFVYYLVPLVGGYNSASYCGANVRYCTVSTPPVGFIPQPYPWGPGTASNSPTPSNSATGTQTATSSSLATVTHTGTGTQRSISATATQSSSYVGWANDPCNSNTHTAVNDSSRRVTNVAGGSACDATMTTGWYRFVDADFSFVATNATPGRGCGSRVALYLPGPYPSIAAQSLPVYALASDTGYRFMTVTVRHCGDFFGRLLLLCSPAYARR